MRIQTRIQFHGSDINPDSHTKTVEVLNKKPFPSIWSSPIQAIIHHQLLHNQQPLNLNLDSTKTRSHHKTNKQKHEFLPNKQHSSFLQAIQQLKNSTKFSSKPTTQEDLQTDSQTKSNTQNKVKKKFITWLSNTIESIKSHTRISVIVLHFKPLHPKSKP